MLIDSHCHLNDLDLSIGDLHTVLAEAKAMGVGHMLNVCIDLEHFPAVLAMSEHCDAISASVGLHPTEQVAAEPTVEQLVTLAHHSKVVALGETGLDYYRDANPKAIQQQRFRCHIRAAKRINKPLIVHTRQAAEDTLAILIEEEAASVGGVLHCFTGDLAMAEAAIWQNFYISFSGILTFPNAEDLRSVARQLPLDRLLIETDAPYLTPVPFRGKPNQPAYVHYVAERLAALHGKTFMEVAQQTTSNFFRLFKGAKNI